jgi:hypothetical protein
MRLCRTQVGSDSSTGILVNLIVTDAQRAITQQMFRRVGN